MTDGERRNYRLDGPPEQVDPPLATSSREANFLREANVNLAHTRSVTEFSSDSIIDALRRSCGADGNVRLRNHHPVGGLAASMHARE